MTTRKTFHNLKGKTVAEAYADSPTTGLDGEELYNGAITFAFTDGTKAIIEQRDYYGEDTGNTVEIELSRREANWNEAADHAIKAAMEIDLMDCSKEQWQEYFMRQMPSTVRFTDAEIAEARATYNKKEDERITEIIKQSGIDGTPKVREFIKWHERLHAMFVHNILNNRK